MNIIPFQFESTSVRVINKEGEPWFVAKDVANALGYPEAAKMTRFLDTDEKALHSVATLGGNQELSTINESGLYSAILKSRRNEAKKFKKWVTKEVLPSIRKHGAYINGQEIDDQKMVMAKALIAVESMLKSKNMQLQMYKEEYKALRPKLEAFDRIADSEGTVCITVAAKKLQLRPKELFTWLSENKWIYRRSLKGTWAAYQSKILRGLLTHKVTTRYDWKCFNDQVRVTPKGLTSIATELGRLH